MTDNDQEIDRRAQEKFALYQLESRLQDAVASGKAKHGAEFDAAFSNLTSKGLDPAVVATIAETEAPAEVLFALGKDPSQVERLRGMTPDQQYIEVLKMGVNVSRPKPTPQPPAAPSLYDERRETPAPGLPGERSPWQGAKGDKASNDEAWFAERARQKANSVGRPWSPRKR
jgi:hypothetical protein